MEKEESGNQEKTYKILVVDDEKDVLDSLLLTLKHTKELNSEIAIASDGEEAMGKIMKESFDLVLTDYKMPGMNGVELLTKVKDKHPDAVRILITGYSDIDTAMEAINKAQVDNYIEKPCHKDELRSTVLSALIRKNEREVYTSTKVNSVKQGLEIVKEAKKKLSQETNNAIPMMGAKQVIILEFKSPAEFNKFSFEVRQMKNVAIDDIQIFENKYVIKIGLFLESFEKIM